MFDKVIYYATTFAEACLAVFGASWLFEQPAYTVTRDLGADVEIRAYGPAIAAETTAAADTKDKASAAAFRLLFEYITRGQDRYHASGNRRGVALQRPFDGGKHCREAGGAARPTERKRLDAHRRAVVPGL